MIVASAVWRVAVLVVATAPLVYYVLATVAALRFFRRERARTFSDYTPPVSILKPVRGVDFGSYENYSSFCGQDYPDYEILFAVNDDADPAVPLIRNSIRSAKVSSSRCASAPSSPSVREYGETRPTSYARRIGA